MEIFALILNIFLCSPLQNGLFLKHREGWCKCQLHREDGHNDHFEGIYTIERIHCIDYFNRKYPHIDYRLKEKK